MFWGFELSFVIDILASFDLETFGAIFEKLGEFFSNLLVTLVYQINEGCSGLYVIL
jgi:hypothetical protein